LPHAGPSENRIKKTRKIYDIRQKIKNVGVAHKGNNKYIKTTCPAKPQQTHV